MCPLLAAGTGAIRALALGSDLAYSQCCCAFCYYCFILFLFIFFKLLLFILLIPCGFGAKICTTPLSTSQKQKHVG